MPLPSLNYYDDLYRSRKANRPVVVDPLADELEKERNREIREGLFLSASPETIARVNRISRAVGEPPLLVEDRVDAYEKSIANERFMSVVQESPAFGSWAASNFRAAAGAADDHVALRKVARAFDPVALSGGAVLKNVPEVEPTLWNSVKGVLASLVGGAQQTRTGLNVAIADWLPNPFGSESDNRAFIEGELRDFRYQGATIDAARPAFKSSTASGAYSGVSSVARMAPGIVASVLTRSPAPALTLAGGQSGVEAYGKYRARGGTRSEALLGGTLEGGIEVVTEKLPMGVIVDTFGKVGAGRFLSDFLGKEMLGEQAATFAQDAVDTAIANPDKTWGEFWAERPEAAYQTGVATLVSSGVLAGGSEVAKRAEQRKLSKAQAMGEGIFLDTLADASAESKLRTRDPEDFKALIEHLTQDTAAENVFIPADKVREFMQSDGYVESNFWRDYQDDIAEAYASGADLVVPIATAMANIAGTPAWAALKDEMRLSPGGASRSEVAALADETQAISADFDGLVSQVGSDGARGQLFSSVYDKLTNAGFTPSTARVQAELLSQRYSSRSARMGVTLTGKEFDGVQVTQVLPERISRARKAEEIDLVVNALRKGGEASSQSGKSLVEWIAARGGINDVGGDLKAIGLDRWHKERPFRKKVLRNFDPTLSMGLTGAGDFGADSILQAAIDEGYFPELQGSEDLIDGNILLDAIAEELGGSPRYSSDAQVDDVRAAASDLADLLEQSGLDAATMSDAEIKAFVSDFADTQGRTFNQDGKGGPRATISFPAQAFGDGPVIINLFNSRNLSSFLHESGHLFLEELKADASLPDAPDSVKQDWAIVSGWFAENGHAVGGTIPEDAHELWARGFERYLMEGKAPASSVQAVFDTMRSWLIAIYRRVENLKAPINNDIRQVMDRLIATDEEISDVSAAQKLDPVFETAAAAGMTGPEFDAYMELVASAKSTARTEVLEKTMRVLKARDTRQYKALEADIRAEVAQMVDARPEIRALTEARKAPLNSQWIIDRFGQDALSLLPKSVPPVHKANGANPELVGELAGVENGRALVQTLMGLEQQRKTMRANGDKRSVRLAMIEQETADMMAERYGDPFNDGSIEEEALAAVHNDIQGEVIAAEIRALARKTRQRATPYSVARQWARQKVRSGKVRDHLTKAAIQQYRRNAAKNATDAFTALAAGRSEDALRHKQAQLVNNALVREARDAMEELQDALKRLEKTARKATIASVDQDYLDQAHTLLEAVDLRKRSQRALERQGKFEAWARDREAEGFDIAVPPSFEATIGQTNWTRLSAEELLGLDAAVKQILHLGRLKQTLLDNQEERDFDAVVGEALSTIDRLPKRAPRDMTDPGKLDQFKSFVLGSHAALLKMETVFNRLDGGKGGAFDRVVFQPISEAQATEKRIMREYLAELDGHLANVPKATLAMWEDKLTIEDLYDKETGEPVRTERGKLISMALNMGNEGNAAKLAGGYGWSEERVMRVLNRELTAPEWQYVQSVWDTINKLWPSIAELERRVNGVVPEKVQPRELQTSAGTLAGGYFPVVYDASRNLRVEALSAESTDKLFGNSYSRATTSQGFTKARTDVERPINLSLDVMTRHIAEVIHDITHREPIMQADRFLSSERIAKAVNETLGADVRKQFRPWLQHIANEWAYDRAGMSAFESFLKATRRNTTFVGMGFRVSTMLVQAGGYANSFERVGARWVLEGLNLFLRNPRSTAEFVLERSLEVRDRTESLDRDIRDNVRSAIGKRDLPSAIRRYAFAGIGFMDRVVVIPTWLGAYNKALASGVEEDAAIHVADSAVRESQGSGAAKDLASVQRGKGNTGEVMKLLTMFYTFQSAQYQRFVNLGWDISDSVRERRADLVPEIAARSWWLLVVGPVLSAIISGNTPEDEEGWAEWAAKLSLFNLSGPVPIVRDAVPVLGKKLSGDKSFPYRFTPAAGAIESAERVAGDVKNVAEGDDTKRATRNALELIGYSTGLVPGQAAASAQFVVDVLSGDADPEGLGNWWEGLSKGRLKD